MDAGKTTLASLTVRQLDDKLKTLLRLRAARHGRSMEDEVRVILREAAAQADRSAGERFAPAAHPKAQAPSSAAESGPRIVLIIGGGIAAYKSLDLIRRLQERGARLRCILTAAARHFVTQLAVGALIRSIVHRPKPAPGARRMSNSEPFFATGLTRVG